MPFSLHLSQAARPRKPGSPLPFWLTASIAFVGSALIFDSALTNGAILAELQNLLRRF
jgi:hypothetical protein